MAVTRGKPEDIVLMLRRGEVLPGQGKSISDAVRQNGCCDGFNARDRGELCNGDVVYILRAA